MAAEETPVLMDKPVSKEKPLSIKVHAVSLRQCLMHRLPSKEVAHEMSVAVKGLIDHPEKPEIKIGTVEDATLALRRLYVRGDTGRVTAEEAIAALRIIAKLGEGATPHRNLKDAATALRQGLESSKGTEKDVMSVCSGVCSLYKGIQKAVVAPSKEATKKEREAAAKRAPKKSEAKKPAAKKKGK